MKVKVKVSTPCNNKIEAIKAYRWLTGFGLIECKKFIEALPDQVTFAYEVETNLTPEQIKKDNIFGVVITIVKQPLIINIEIIDDIATVNVSGHYISCNVTIPFDSVPQLLKWVTDNFGN